MNLMGELAEAVEQYEAQRPHELAIDRRMVVEAFREGYAACAQRIAVTVREMREKLEAQQRYERRLKE